MKFLILKTTSPYVNLATEEYLFKNLNDDVFMLWQNEPSIIIGKNQNAFAEINMDYAKENNLHIVRRITGGGAVYHDLGNVNYTFISTRSERGGIDFEHFTLPIIESLKTLGIDAKLSGRNDLTVNDRKFSGNAQHTVGDRVLHHGTLLFDGNLDVLTSALNVDEEKLKAKAVKSVRSRVVNLKTIINRDIDVNQFIKIISDFVISKFNPEIISAPNPDEIESIVKRNESDEWIYPDRVFLSDYTVTKKKKYPFGLVQMNLNMSNYKIKEIKIFGDFFGSREISELEDIIKGHSVSEIENLLQNISVNDYIFGMSNDLFSEHIKM